MAKLKLSLICLGVLLGFACALNIRKDTSSMLPDLMAHEQVSEGGIEEEEPLHRITLKKMVMSSEEKIKSIQMLSTTQSYDYNKSDYSSRKDFVAAQREKSQMYSSSSSSSNTHSLSLYNFKNVQYTGSLSIGSLSNTFNVIYDTGSANIFINSVHCTDEGCLNHKQYDSSKSPTYEKVGLDLDVQFGTGELIGEFARDTVFFGDVEVKNQEFAQIVEERGGIFAASHFDGIVGLAFPSMAAYNKNPLFDNLMAQKKVKNNVFSFYMGAHNGQSDSEITIGGSDKNRYTGKINYHKVLKDYYWLVAAEQILVGGKDVGLCKGGCYVIADTGTSLISGPTEDIFTLLDSVNVDVGCKNVSELPDITFVLDGIKYNLTSKEYVLQEDQEGNMSTLEAAKSNLEMGSSTTQCAPAFMPLDIPNDDGFQYEKAWILGDTFLQKYYSVYDRDQGKVGFAQARRS